jgi:hypothetical protein
MRRITLFTIVLVLMLVTIGAVSAQNVPTPVDVSTTMNTLGPFAADTTSTHVVRTGDLQFCRIMLVPDPDGPSRNPEFTANATETTGHAPTFLKVGSRECSSQMRTADGVTPNNVSNCYSPFYMCAYWETFYRGNISSYIDLDHSSCVPGGYAISDVGPADIDVYSSISTGTLFGCQATVLYKYTNFGGASYTCYGDCTTLGSMNDQTASLWVY